MSGNPRAHGSSCLTRPNKFAWCTAGLAWMKSLKIPGWPRVWCVCACGARRQWLSGGGAGLSGAATPSRCGPGRFYLSAPSLRNLHFRADWSSEGFPRCSLSTPMGCDIRVKFCTLHRKERAEFDMAHAELFALERTPCKTHRNKSAAGRRPRGPSQAELRRPRRASNGTGPSAAVNHKVRTGPTARSAPGTLICHHCLPS